MAKAENTPKTGASGLTGGLDFGASKEAKELQRLEQEQEKKKNEPATAGSIVEGYKKTVKHYERRSVKFNILITPTIAMKMDQAIERGELRSRNDLINHLLEVYFEEDSRTGR